MLKTMFKIIEWSLFGIIACLCGLLLFANFSHNFPLKSYTVLTGSMQPSIPVGSMVFALPAQHQDLQVGSIITFNSPQEPNKLIVHRIHRIIFEEQQKVYFTKGDNNDAVDNWKIYDLQIQGQAAFYLPYLGYLSGYSKTPFGFLTALGLPAVFLVLLYIRHIIVGIREYADHKAKKAVGEYIHSQRKAQVLHQMLKVGALVFFLPVTTVYAAFSANININNVTFTTASSFSSISPSPQPSATGTPIPSIEPSIMPSPSTFPSIPPSVSPSVTPTLTPTPSGSPCTSNCSKIILHQSGSSSSVHVQTTTGGTTVTVNGQTQNSSNSQNTLIHIQSNTQ
jgi:signal peptidase